MIKLLSFLNLLDDSGNLSITNIALIAFFTKILFSPQLDGASVVAMVSLLANYMHKRSVISQDSSNDKTTNP